MNRFIERILSFVLSAACMLTCVSCAGGSSKAKLSVYLTDSNQYMIDCVDTLSDRSKAPEVEKKVFLSEDTDKFVSEVISGISSGEGPDIIIFSPNEYSGLKSLIQEGLLCDLNNLIKKDKSFKLSDYNEKVMDCGVIDGKRYFLPISFYIPALFTTKEILDENGMDPEAKALDWSKLSELAKDTPPVADYYFDRYFSFADIMESSGLDLYNSIDNTSKFDSQEFIELLDMYKSISKSICPILDEENINNDLKRQSNLLKSKIDVLVRMPSGNPKNLYIPYSSYESEVNPVTYPLPSYKGVGTITAQPVQMAAISSKCKNKDAAFKYVKLLLSEEYQAGSCITFCPVNNVAYEKIKDGCLKDKEFSGGIQSDASLQVLVDSLDKIMKGIGKCTVPDGSIIEIIQSQLQDFLNGSKTAAETSELIQGKVQSYFKEGNTAAVTASESSTEKIDKKPPLKMHLLSCDNMFLSRAVNKFNSMYKDISIETSTFSSDTYKNKIAAEIASGEGPDIIRVDGYTFPSIHKVMANGIFCDLNELINGDEDFDLSDYNEEILKAGIYNGKRYIMPIDYYYFPFYTTQKMLDDNQIAPDFKKWDWESFTAIVRKFIADNEKKQEYLIGWDFGFLYMLFGYGKDFVDFNTKEASFNSKEFIRLLEVYKEIYPAICPNSVSSKYGDPFYMISNNITVFLGGVNNLQDPFWLSKKIEGIEDFRIIPYPTYDGKYQIYAQPLDSLAINDRCKNKEEAWNFIKVALDSKKIDPYGVYNYAPVNKKHFESLKSELLKNNKEICNLIDNVKCNGLQEGAINNIIYNEMPDFLDSKKTAEQTAKIINDKVILYLNE